MKTMTIQGVVVEVSTPYEAGHQITEAEAKALNQVRAENVGNNLRKTITDMKEAAGGDVEAIKADVQAMVTEYEASYEFTLASVGGGSTSRLDPLTKEARSIARQFIAAKLREAGISQKEYLESNGEDAIKIKIAELAENPQVIELAQKALNERAAMADVKLKL